MSEVKHRRGWGSVRQFGENSWQVRYPSLNAEGDPGPRRNLTVHGTRSDALAALKSLERAYRQDKEAFKRLRAEREKDSQVSRNATVNQVWRTIYVPSAEKRLSPLTLRTYCDNYNLYIYPVIGTKRLRNVTHDDVQALLDKHTHTIANKVKVLLKSLFDEAQNARVLKPSENVLSEKYRLPKNSKRKNSQNIKLYRREEVDEILTLCVDEPFEAAIILMAIGGARMAEASGVKFSDMSFSKDEDGLWCRVNIMRNAIMCGDQLVIHGTKNARSRRTIFIPEPYSLRLKDLHEQATDDEWVTDDGTGVPLASFRLSYLWRTWGRENAPRYVPFMYFRDSFATDMHNRGMDPYRIAQLMGHSSTSQMLYKHYDRPDDDTLMKCFSDAYKNKPSGLDDMTKEKLMKIIAGL